MVSLPLKPLPRDYGYADLFAPNTTYVYFENAEWVPFLEDEQDYSLVHAWWLADASFLAYVREAAFIEKVLQEAGLEDFVFFDRGGTQVYVAGGERFMIVAFRGTERHEPEDIFHDLKIGLVREPGDGRVHRGFQEALNHVWDDLSKTLHDFQHAQHPPRQAWFTGHSMGGALALLAARRYKAVTAVYTYGCPRAGDGLFRRDYPVPCYRVVNNNDGVPLLPPPIRYRHVGKLVYIDHQGRVHLSIPAWRRMHDGWAGALWHIRTVVARYGWSSYRQILWDRLVDHAPVMYATHLWNAMVLERLRQRQ